MKKNRNSNRVFGLFFFIFFLVLSSFSFIFLKGQINYLFFSLAIFFLFLVLINSKILTPLNRLWIYFGIFLGKITAPIIMIIVYLFILIPISFLKKISNKNYLNINQDNNLDTYWEKNDKHFNMKDQF